MRLTARLARIALVLAAWLACLSISQAQEEPTQRSDRSYYLRLRDGVRVAVSLHFPGGTPPSTPSPTVLILTRYGRAFVFMHGDIADFYQTLRDAGYVVATVDTRGSTSSFGPREVDLGPEEVSDTAEIIAHLAQAPWSDGSVFSTGVSYMATTADVATSVAAPALKGAVIRHPDFDPFLSFQRPGGVEGLVMERWAKGTYGLDVGERTTSTQTLNCRAQLADCAQLWPWLQPVDEDSDFALMREALAGRKRWTMETYARVEFRDDKGTNGYHLFATTGGSRMAEIRARAVPVQLWASWYDADTAAGMLARFQSAPNVSTELWITANDHPERTGADPFYPSESNPLPSPAEQQRLMRGFLDQVRTGAKPERVIHYYVLGAQVFKQTTQWPPSGVHSQFLALGRGRALVPHESRSTLRDRYEVDFSATTGKHTRWSLSPHYEDRQDEDRKVLVYDGPALEAAVELVGTPVVTLQLASATRDPAIHVYLEDVAPDGRVTYLSEGVFRAVHRKPALGQPFGYDAGPAPHSYLRSAAAFMQPGKVATIEFAMFPLAAKIDKGHRLRVAIAGADVDNFRRYSEGKPESFEIHSNPRRPSGIAIQVRPWMP